MKVINTKVHGVLDYLVGAFLLAMPWLLGFYKGGFESSVPLLMGVATILYSLITDYEFGIANALSMKAHLVIDAVSGIFLIASPWLFGFHNVVYLPHVAVGAMELLVVALSSGVAYQNNRKVLGV